MTEGSGFTEKQMAVGKEEFERRLEGLREYAYSDYNPILTRSIAWEVAYVDALRVRAGIADRLAAALEGVRAINTAYRTGSQPSGKALDAANKSAAVLAEWAASGADKGAEK